ncbi:CBS domain-containing protein [Rossellomorea sp. GAMAL-10_SWC]
MLAKHRMLQKHQVITVQSNDTVESAIKLLLEKQIDSVPVLAGNKYIGMISQAEIYRSCFYNELPKEEYITMIKIGEIATHKTIYVKADEPYEDTMNSLKKYPSIAVVDDERNFVGLVIRYDVIEIFQEVLGKDCRGIRISMTSMEKEGQLARLLEYLHHFRINIISLVTFDSKDHLLRRIVLKIDDNKNIDKILRKFEELGLRIVSVTNEIENSTVKH